MALTFVSGITWSNGAIANAANLNAAVNSASYTGTLEVTAGGTGSTSAATARTALGVGTGDSPTFVTMTAKKASEGQIQVGVDEGADTYNVVHSRNDANDAYLPLKLRALGFGVEGGVIVGSAALTTTDTDGFLYIPTCAGTPTGVPTTQTGTAALVYDSTNNVLCIYDGGWRSIATT